MTGQTQGPRRLIEGLLALPASTRTTLGVVQIHEANGHATVACHSLLDESTRLAGGSLLADNVHGQISEVAESGLFGKVSVTTSTAPNAATQWTLRLWRDKPDRATALEQALATGEAGAALIAAVDEQRVAHWRLTQAADSSASLSAKVLTELGVQVASGPPDTTARSRTADPAELVRMKMGHSAPCVICGLPAKYENTGRSVHQGECLRVLVEQDHSPHEDGAGAESVSYTPPALNPNPEEMTSTAPVADEGTEESPAHEQESEVGESRGSMSLHQAGGLEAVTRVAVARFRAPVVVLDAEIAHFPDGSTESWSASHLGEVAFLAKQLKLGYGGGKSLPDVGQVWLTAAAATRLGLPPVVPGAAIKPEEALTKDQAAKRIAKAMAKVAKKGAVQDAVDADWDLGERGLDAWTRFSHPDLLPHGAWVVLAPWQRVASVPLFVGNGGEDLTAPVLAERLGRFAQAVGTTYELTPPITTQQLVDHTRPPRPADSPVGERVSLQRAAPQLPPFLNEERYAQIERDFSWWRPWKSLSEEERSMPYVNAWDRTWSYLAPWSSVYLGVEDLEHHTGDDAAWDGQARSSGYWLVDKWEWPHWGLPDPLTGHATTGFASNNRIWVTTPTLEQLRMVGITPQIYESWRWHTTARYLDIAGRTLVGALEGSAKGDPVHETVKSMYRAGVSKFAQRGLRRGHHLGRRDWRDHIVAATRTQILYNLKAISERPEGRVPLVVSTDAIIYASSTPDLVEGWVGDPKRLTASKAGGWKPLKWGELATWGPTHLAPRDGGWPYRDAMNALKDPES